MMHTMTKLSISTLMECSVPITNAVKNTTNSRGRYSITKEEGCAASDTIRAKLQQRAHKCRKLHQSSETQSLGTTRTHGAQQWVKFGLLSNIVVDLADTNGKRSINTARHPQTNVTSGLESDQAHEAVDTSWSKQPRRSL